MLSLRRHIGRHPKLSGFARHHIIFGTVQGDVQTGLLVTPQALRVVHRPPSSAEVIQNILKRPRDVPRIDELLLVEGLSLQLDIRPFEIEVQIRVVDLSDPCRAPIVQQGHVTSSVRHVRNLIRQVTRGDVQHEDPPVARRLSFRGPRSQPPLEVSHDVLAPVRALLPRLQGDVEAVGHHEVVDAAVGFALAQKLDLQKRMDP